MSDLIFSYWKKFAKADWSELKRLQIATAYIFFSGLREPDVDENVKFSSKWSTLKF